MVHLMLIYNLNPIGLISLKNKSLSKKRNVFIFSLIFQQYLIKYFIFKGFIETTLYERFILVFWPECTEFYALLSIDYKSAVDFLHEIIIINNKTDEKINKYIEDLIKSLIRIRYSNKQTINNDYISKMLQILKAIKDLKTTKQIISLIISNLTEEIIREIVNLFDIFEWNDLEQDIIELMSPVSLNNINDNCSFVKVI